MTAVPTAGAVASVGLTLPGPAIGGAAGAAGAAGADVVPFAALVDPGWAFDVVVVVVGFGCVLTKIAW